MNHIVLFEPEKPANVGNIIRTCMCLGADLVVVGYTSFDISDKSLKRAGMDYLSGVNITKYDTFSSIKSQYNTILFSRNKKIILERKNLL